VTAVPALAELNFPQLSYRTGPYAAGGIPFADGYADYFTLLNERDGGIGGGCAVTPNARPPTTPRSGVECYEAIRDTILWSAAAVDRHHLPADPAHDRGRIPLHTMGYGRTSAADGKVFEWVFNYPATYWDAASIIVKYLLDENEGSLDGKKIVLVYHNSAYGREPIRTLEELAEKHGYNFSTIAVDHPGQEQRSQWLEIRRSAPTTC
jgi:branched-chain amino acid transport system substrate-binding protein